MIKRSTIEEIKSRMDVYEVVSDFVRLKKSGSGYKGMSPFTNEKTPSFMVSPAKGIFKCFSSGKGGDAISFMMEIDGLSYVEALKYLAQKYGVEIIEDEVPANYKEEQSNRESLFIILNFAKDYYKKNLHQSDEGKSIGLSYFKERGFDDEIIDTFELGYAFDQWDGLIKATKAGGYKEDFLEASGLKIVKENKQYDRFRGRVIFPIHNMSGKVIAFGARILKLAENQPKYINSPETDLYHKSNILYGIFQSKNAIRNEDNCYLVEGYTDVISLHQAGIKNVVASSGTALTEDQIRLIKRFTDNITVLFDGDRAGVKASMRGIDMILEGGLNVKAVPFPEGQDPDSYSKELGGEVFKTYLSDNAKDFISFKTDTFLEEGKNDPLKKAEAIREIVQSIALIPDPIKRTVYIQQCSLQLGIDEDVLIREQNKLLIKKSRERNKKVENAVLDEVPEVEEFTKKKGDELDYSNIIALQEKESIRMLINYGADTIWIKNKENKDEQIEQSIINYYLNEFEDIEFETPVYKKILEIFKSKLKEGIIIDSTYLMASDDEAIKREAVDLITKKYEVSKHWNDKYKIFVPDEKDTLKSATYTNVVRLKFRIIQKMIEENLTKLKASESEKDTDELLDIQTDLKKMEMSIAEILGNVTVK